MGDCPFDGPRVNGVYFITDHVVHILVFIVRHCLYNTGHMHTCKRYKGSDTEGCHSLVSEDDANEVKIRRGSD